MTWDEAERAADADIKAGRVSPTFTDPEAGIRWLLDPEAYDRVRALIDRPAIVKPKLAKLMQEKPKP